VQDEVALGLLQLDLGADGQLGERALEGSVAQPRGEAEHARLRRRGHDGDGSARALLVVVGRVEELDPEVLPGPVVNLLREDRR